MSLSAVQIYDFHIFLAVHYKFHKAVPERDSKLILHYNENFNTQTNNPLTFTPLRVINYDWHLQFLIKVMLLNQILSTWQT